MRSSTRRFARMPPGTRLGAVLLAAHCALAGCATTHDPNARAAHATDETPTCPIDQEDGQTIDGFVVEDATFSRVFEGWHRDGAHARVPTGQCIRTTAFSHRAVVNIEWHHLAAIAQGLGHPDHASLLERHTEFTWYPGQHTAEHVFEIPRAIVEGIAALDDAARTAFTARVTEIVRADVGQIGSDETREAMLAVETEARWTATIAGLSHLARSARRPDQRVFVYRFD